MKLRGPFSGAWEQLEELENTLFDNAFNATTLRREHELGAEFWLFVEDNVVLAYMMVRQSRGCTDIQRLGVHPKYQGIGLGSKLLWLAKSLYGNLMLCVRKHNKRALKLYTQQGFRIDGELELSWTLFYMAR